MRVYTEPTFTAPFVSSRLFQLYTASTNTSVTLHSEPSMLPALVTSPHSLHHLETKLNFHQHLLLLPQISPIILHPFSHPYAHKHLQILTDIHPFIPPSIPLPFPLPLTAAQLLLFLVPLNQQTQTQIKSLVQEFYLSMNLFNLLLFLLLFQLFPYRICFSLLNIVCSIQIEGLR